MTGATSPHPTGAQFTIRRGDEEATVVEVGGGLRSYRVDGHEVLDGYGVDEMAPSGRGQLLIPWPNRLDHGRYTWDRVEHVAPINEPDRSNAIHGLVRFLGWSGSLLGDDRAEMRTVLWPSPGYPFTLELVVTYELDDSGLSVTTTSRNGGAAPAPYGMGQHPYLWPPSGLTVDECELTIPATSYLETDDRGLPVGVRPVAGTAFDFTAGRPLGGLALDTAFAHLTPGADGLTRVRLVNGERSIAVWMDGSHRYVQVFTGDTLPESRRRTSVAIEPMTCPANALATGTDLIRLEPGEAVTTRWGIAVSTHRRAELNQDALSALGASAYDPPIMSGPMQEMSVVVIGGSSGIGLATARLASAAGARVTIAGRDEDRLAAALQSLPADARGVALDVADEMAVRDLFDSFDHVDHVATLAGTHVSGALADLDTDALRGPVDNRFWGPLYIGKYAAPKMTTGSITMCTGAGVARPRAGNTIVTAAAGGSEFLARAMAVELAPVRVNVVRPGIVDTPLLDRLAPGNRDEVIKAMAKRVPLGRVAQPEEIADAILFLMSNQYVTGTTLTIDGGAGLA